MKLNEACEVAPSSLASHRAVRHSTRLV